MFKFMSSSLEADTPSFHLAPSTKATLICLEPGTLNLQASSCEKRTIHMVPLISAVLILSEPGIMSLQAGCLKQ